METKEKIQMRFTERDFELLRFMGKGRLFSLQQLARLCYVDLDETNLRSRLTQLGVGTAKKAGMKLVERRHYAVVGDAELKSVWVLTGAGRGLLANRFDMDVPDTENASPEFYDHAVTLNELWVRLLEVGPCTPKLATTGKGKRSYYGHYASNFTRFEWAAFGEARLPWKQAAGGELVSKVLSPDAIITVPSSKRRYFIENERGTHPIESTHERQGSTLNKVERFEAYVNGIADIKLRMTHYRQRYADGFTPELVFVVHSEQRKKNVRAAVDRWSAVHAHQPVSVHVWTIDDATLALGKVIYGADLRTQMVNALADGRSYKDKAHTEPSSTAEEKVALLEGEVQQQAEDLKRIRGERAAARDELQKSQADLARVRDERNKLRELLLGLHQAARKSGTPAAELAAVEAYMTKVGLLRK